LVFPRAQAAMGLGDGRGDLFPGYVAINIQMKAAMVGVALGAEALVVLRQDMDGGMFQPVIATDSRKD